MSGVDAGTALDLPDDLELPLLTGEPWWYFIGGRPSVDFANTLRERWWRRVETLVTPNDLERWLMRARLLDGPADASAAMLESARWLREAIDGAFGRTIAGETPATSDLDAINEWLTHAPRPPRLMTSAGLVRLEEARPRDPVGHALGLLALDAAQILGDERHRPRLRICASETCSARFYDNSRAGRRQWCSMQTCGNVAKARRYRARHADHDETRS
jgi:predicted RNA-binding Zn ribbon-like protein